jgi:putative DNA primase/helicase
MRNASSGEPCGVQRTALNPDATKIERMMLGPAGVVRLWPADSTLVIGEGLETVLSAATRLTYRDAPLQPAWAALGALARFPVINGVGRLIVLADNDLNGAGQRAAAECEARWLEFEREGVVLTPDRPGSDFNDIVLERKNAS